MEFNPQPPLVIYKRSKCHDITLGNMESAVESHTDFPESGGMYVSFEGMPFRKKGWPTIENTESINIVKRITLFTFRNWPLLFFKRNITRYIELIDYVLDNPFKLYLLKHSTYYKERYYTVFTREFRHLLENFLKEIKVDLRLAEIFAMIIELDDAYRFRLQDLFSETTKEVLLKNPYKEVSRLIDLGLKRDDENIRKKTRVFTSLLKKLLLIPKFKKAFKYAIDKSDFKKLQYDDSDRYFCLHPSCYKHMGMNETQKMLKYMFIHQSGLPPTTTLL